MKIKLINPLISCICITDNRHSMLQNAIYHFERQSYPNRELVISYPKSDWSTASIIVNLQRNSDIRITGIERNENISLSQARNEAIRKSKGEFICIWDDDDWYDPSRLSVQHNMIHMKAKFSKASILSNILLYDATTKSSFCTELHNWENTLFCNRSILLEYPYTDKHSLEEQPIIQYLQDNKLLLSIEGMFNLYIHHYHGDNTINHIDYSNIKAASTQLTKESTDRIRGLIEFNAVFSK